jgi:hypothetical protein
LSNGIFELQGTKLLKILRSKRAKQVRIG